MRNVDLWSPTKFERHRGRWRASRDPREVGPGSQLMADLIAARYQELVPRHVRGRLIDLGCGKVPLFGLYRDHADSVTCVDWAESYHDNQHVDRICDLTQPLPFDDGAFDTVVLSDVLEHIPDPPVLWAEMARILGPGGKLLLNVPFLYWLHEQPHDFYRYTEHALRRFAEQAGFTVLLLEPIGGAPEVLADVQGKHVQSLPVIGPGLARLLQGLTRWFVATTPGGHLSRKTAARFPLGYVLVAQRSAAG